MFKTRVFEPQKRERNAKKESGDKKQVLEQEKLNSKFFLFLFLKCWVLKFAYDFIYLVLVAYELVV